MYAISLQQYALNKNWKKKLITKEEGESKNSVEAFEQFKFK